MKTSHHRLAARARDFFAILALACAPSFDAAVQEPQHLAKPHPGGMPGVPVITSITKGTNGLVVNWDGPAGGFQLLKKGDLADSQWKPSFTGTQTTGAAAANEPAGFFILRGPAPHYAGSRACLECHSPIADTVNHTRHATAFTSSTFVALGGQTDAACMACHNVGYGLPTGFVSLAQTPELANVQCENCHGPAAMHAANPEDPTTRPRVDLAATLCGGCHTRESVPRRALSYHPSRFEEWNKSSHATVGAALKTSFAENPGNIATCGSCHSGSVRHALLANRNLPSAQEAGAVAIACAVCHDAHEQYAHTNVLNGLKTNLLTGLVITNTQLGLVYTNQMRSPLASLADFHSMGNFATNFNSEINLCAQCHNDRGASAKMVDAPPHGSSQYNMLLGAFRQEDTGIPSSQPGAHALLEKQCVTCHMQTVAGASGHTFKVDNYTLCATCHSDPEPLVQFTKTAVLYNVQRDKAALDFWAALKAPPALQKYGSRAWEYPEAGPLSAPGPSPTVAEQSMLPPNIQKARFILYLVFNEGSLGAHNGPYTAGLLTSAYDLVLQELQK
jgi:hypothetical protein